MPKFTRAKSLLQNIAQRPVHYCEAPHELIEFGWNISSEVSEDEESTVYHIKWKDIVLQVTKIKKSGSSENKLNEENLEYFLQECSKKEVTFNPAPYIT